MKVYILTNKYYEPPKHSLKEIEIDEAAVLLTEEEIVQHRWSRNDYEGHREGYFIPKLLQAQRDKVLEALK